MKLHLWIWGVIGAGAAVTLGLVGMNIAPQANLGCLASLLIPLAVGCMAARASAATNRTTSVAQGATDGGIAAAIAAVVGGTISLLTGCASIPTQLVVQGTGNLLGLLLPGIAVLALAYFLQGCIVGVVAVSLRSASKD